MTDIDGGKDGKDEPRSGFLEESDFPRLGEKDKQDGINSMPPFSGPLEKQDLPRRKRDSLSELEDRVANLTEELELREKELAGAREEALRAVADAENFRKRLERERDNQRKRDGAALVVSFLPVLDTLDQALAQDLKDWSGGEKFREGIELTRQQFHDILVKKGLERIETLNKPFDPVTSEALMVEDTTEHEDGLVIRELSPGYMINGALARPARVCVAHNTSEVKANTSDEEVESGQ